jgi:diaminopimelate decarboxylase
MSFHAYLHDRLHVGQIALEDLANRYGTPLYVYSRPAIEQQWRNFHDAFGARNHLICYAVKANSNLSLLACLARLGSGFDIVSGGELERVLTAGGDPKKIVFSGVGKTEAEISSALKAGIRCLNCESLPELRRIDTVASGLGVKAPIALRINPDVDAETHPYIATGLQQNKFGIAWEDAVDAYEQALKLPNIEITGIACHIGSQITTLSPYIDSIKLLNTLIPKLAQKGIKLRDIDLGGGLGIRYSNEEPPAPTELARIVRNNLTDDSACVIIEPGRSIVGNAGWLITKVQYLKHTKLKNFAIVDAAMNDLLRPALYSSWHDILPLTQHADVTERLYDVVGPVCESGDFLGRERRLALRDNDYLAIASAGAYGFSMSSNYNSRPRAAEILIDGDQARLIRKREVLSELLSGEMPIEIDS